MKSLWAALALISAVLFAGCEDAIKSDPDKIEKRADFGIIKSEQTKDVIMPLSVGRKWYYVETDYDVNGEVSYTGYDSIVVLSEVSLHGEKWFHVQLLSEGDYDSKDSFALMTNTSTGLWFKSCDTCDATLSLMAQYPLKNSPYLIGKASDLMPGEFLPWSEKDGQLYARVAPFNNELIGDKNRSGLKYEYYAKDLKSSAAEYVLFSDYFTENFGIVKQINYTSPVFPSAKTVFSAVEKLEPPEDPVLITPDSIAWGIQGYIGDIDSTVTIATNVSNHTTATINSILVSGDVDITIKSPLNFPVSISPGEHLVLIISIKKQHQGNFNGKLTLVTSVGDFEMPVIGYYL
ncbi:MAG: hypothetical protein ACM3U1_09255 [Chloroflexota bacterium]